MPKAIFWDNDGVLVDTEELYFKATQRVLADVGIALTEADYIELFLIQGRGAFHLATERGMSPADVERLRSDRNVLYGQWLAEAPRTMADVRRVLEALHGRYVMGVVTSSRKDHFDIIHAETGLAEVLRLRPDGGGFPEGQTPPGTLPSGRRAVGIRGVGVPGHRGLGPRARGRPRGRCAVRRRSDPAHPRVRVPGADCVLPSLGDLLRRL